MTMDANIFERLMNGEAIPFSDPEYHKIGDASKETRKLLLEMNNTSEPEEVRRLLAEILGSDIDKSVTVFTPLHINYGKNTKLGKNIFVNFDCTFLDLGGIRIDDNVMLAPGVKLLTESHPIASGDRQTLTTGTIHIKKNAWIGANAVILPGVTIGENSVIAAGAVVSKDVPGNSVAAGIPAKVIKSI
jgi:acetyltransferase-like isoleucine patch superfamily enzyme